MFGKIVKNGPASAKIALFIESNLIYTNKGKPITASVGHIDDRSFKLCQLGP